MNLNAIKQKLEAMQKTTTSSGGNKTKNFNKQFR